MLCPYNFHFRSPAQVLLAKAFESSLTFFYNFCLDTMPDTTRLVPTARLEDLASRARQVQPDPSPSGSGTHAGDQEWRQVLQFSVRSCLPCPLSSNKNPPGRKSLPPFLPKSLSSQLLSAERDPGNFHSDGDEFPVCEREVPQVGRGEGGEGLCHHLSGFAFIGRSLCREASAG